MSDENLFRDFEPITAAEWQEKIKEDLKDKDFDQLVRKIPGDIVIKPFYTAEDITEKNAFSASIIPRAKSGSARSWENLETIPASNAKEANELALLALNSGADGLIFELQDNLPNLDRLLEDIHINHCTIYFSGNLPIGEPFLAYAKARDIPLASLNGGLFSSRTAFAENILQTGKATAFKSLYIRSHSSPEIDIVQELALCLTETVNLLDKLTDKEFDPEDILYHTIFGFEVGTNYFLEIAKLRAFRMLVAMIAAAYKIDRFAPADLHIHCETKVKFETGEDPYNNVLRNTTEAMSAIIGGCNSLYIVPHNGKAKNSNNFSRRIARNISLILKEEAYLDKVVDPASGSYFIENLTQQLIEKTWNVFLNKSKDT